MELRDYLSVLRARKWVIIQAVLVVTLSAVVWSVIQPPVYEGRTKVLVSERDTGAALFGSVIPEISSQPERGLQTQVQLMQLRPLAEKTVRDLGLQMSPGDLLDKLEVSEVGQTNIVTFSARAGDAQTAADIANGMAAAYVDWSRETKRESIRAAADEVESRLNEARDQILEFGSTLSASGTSDGMAAELQLLTGTYTTLAEKLEQLRITEQLEVGAGRVVENATRPGSPIEPRPVQNTALGLAIGLMLGLVMAFLYEYLDDTIKSTDEMEKVYGAPLLGIIPLMKRDKSEGRRLTVLESPGSATAEAYRVLRNSLDFVNFERNIKSLLVTSAVPNEGKSTVSANLALSIVQTGKKVVLISCDFRRPTTEQFFDVNNIIGLSDVLLGTHSLKAALQRPSDEQLLVLTSGKMPPNPSELLGSDKMQALIQELEEWADWIIIDSPPLLAVADPASVSRFTQGTLMISRAGVSTRAVARKTRELLDKVGAHVVGSVVWGLDEDKTDAGYGYGYAGGHYYYSEYHHPVSAESGLTGKKSKSRRSAQGQSNVRFDAEGWSTEPGPVRTLASFVGRLLSGILAFLAVIAIAIIVAYLLSQYFGWDLASAINGILPF